MTSKEDLLNTWFEATELEKVIASSRYLASVLWEYYEALLEQGFSDTKAIQLVEIMQTAILSISYGQTISSE